MPIYSFQCQDCQQEFDLLIGVGQGPEELLCCHCGSKKVKKIFASFGISGSSKGQGGSASASCSSCSTRNCSSCR